MPMSCIPPAEKAFIKHFWLAMALIASIWALLGIGTAIS